MTLTVRSLHFSYGNTEALKGIDLDIGKGVTALLGPNGAGKSTLVKCLARVHKPTSGTAEFDGMNLFGEHPDELRMAYLSQDLPDITNTTVLEVMLLGRVRTLTVSVKEEDIDKSYGALEMLGIEDLAPRNLNELSGGQCQMVMIAQCLVADPDLIILDEPMNNLDLRRELTMFDIMTRITRERGATTLMVLHDVNFASRYADRMVVMRNGSVYDTGTPSEIVSEDMIRDVYGVECTVSEGSDSRPRIDPIRAMPYDS